MSRPEVERQLLLALLAFQNGFLDRTALLTAFDAWSQAKSQPLGDLLVANGAISPDKRQLLDALVDHFLQRFDGDVAKSLAHVSALEASVRDDLQQRAEPNVQASLALVGRATGPAETIVREVGEATSAGTRFHILRPHARGGLGEVFVAEDGELHREVALKQIQARHADDAFSRSRFILEAEITGGLEHPSIVPVYGLGTYADGRPFYAMRFIRGDSLQEAATRFHHKTRRSDAASRSLEFRKLLQRFIDVCNAIDYAHSRGVLHRDLKPGNVMLGAYGETLVVDWGLAKVLGTQHNEPGASATGVSEPKLHPSSHDGSTPTMHGSAIGTPGYMSPEQAAGRIDDLGPASDIYGLGATLYHLLTGRPPISGDDVGEILRKIQRGDFPPPREVTPEVPKPLEAICLKAMALAPGDRYASARAMADDIEHWLADEPVTAGRESFFDRARRWSRKHRAFVGTAAAALVIIAAVSIVSAVAINHSRQNEQTARHQAEASAHTADEQRNLALDTISALVFDVQNQLANRPAMNDLKRRILETARTNLTKISEPSSGASQTVDLLAAYALQKSGDIFVTLGATSDAKNLFRTAYDTFAKFADDHPDNLPAKRDVSVVLNRQGDVALLQGDLTEARKFYEQGRTISEQLAAAFPTDSRAQRDLSISYERLGDVSSQQGDLTVAGSWYERKLALDRKLVEADPHDAVARRNLSISYDRLGDLAVRHGDLAAARKFYQQEWEISRKPAEADAEDAEAQRDFSVACNKLGDITAQLEDFAAAQTLYEQALKIRRTLAETAPTDAQAQRDLSISLAKLGEITTQQGDLAAARKLYEQGLDIRRKLAETDPDDAQAKRDLSIAYEKLGDVTGLQNDWAAAQKLYEQDLEIARKLADADPADAQAQRDLSISYEKLGEAASHQGDLAGMWTFYAQALEIRRKLAETDPTDARAQRDLLISDIRVAYLFQMTEKYKEAAKTYHAAAAILERLDALGMSAEQSTKMREIIQNGIAECEAALKASSPTTPIKSPTRAEPE